MNPWPVQRERTAGNPRPSVRGGCQWWLREYLTGRVAEPPPGLSERGARRTIAFLEHKILPWDFDRLPLEMSVWLGPIGTTIRAIRGSEEG